MFVFCSECEDEISAGAPRGASAYVLRGLLLFRGRRRFWVIRPYRCAIMVDGDEPKAPFI